eukprot:PhM_4_TR8431/c0_g1_i1/m.4029
MHKLSFLLICVIPILLAVPTAVAADTVCYSQSDCQSSKKFCELSTVDSNSGYCQACSDCPNDVGRSVLVGGVCPSWCTCLTHSDCGDSKYCMKSSNGLNVCMPCASCIDGASENGACPAKCATSYSCTSHADCGSASFCSLAHQCHTCDINCIVPAVNAQTPYPWSSTGVGPIDSTCPSQCTNIFGARQNADGTSRPVDGALYYLPEAGKSPSDYTFKSGIGSTGSSVTLVDNVCAVDTVYKMKRFVGFVTCPDVTTARSTCDDNKMGVKVVVRRRSAPTIDVRTYHITYFNGFMCALSDIFSDIGKIILIIFAVVAGLCCFGCAVFCFCCSAASHRRRQATASQYYSQQQAFMPQQDVPVYGAAAYPQQSPYAVVPAAANAGQPVQGIPLEHSPMHSPTGASYYNNNNNNNSGGHPDYQQACPPIGASASPYHQAAAAQQQQQQQQQRQ